MWILVDNVYFLMDVYYIGAKLSVPTFGRKLNKTFLYQKLDEILIRPNDCLFFFFLHGYLFTSKTRNVAALEVNLSRHFYKKL